ncbi:hypothetical protein LCGC14_1014890 [marine sediment metagenome]|uniref:BppU N-terminal domain-containing protein n=1 Tax=marine sediment metagenome TaxID=412755 RepID=A0A0F9R579_9ZZZZ|nr:hypothetical protein [Pricia sp.]
MSASTGVVTVTETPEAITRLNRYTAWERVITFSAVSADETGTATVPINGLLQKIIYKRPDLANNDLTSELVLTDNGDNQIFTTGSGLAENATSLYSVSESLVGEVNLAITWNEAVGSTGTFVVTLRGV